MTFLRRLIRNLKRIFTDPHPDEREQWEKEETKITYLDDTIDWP